MTTKMNHADCTSDFHVTECEMPFEWANQEGDENARLLIHTLLSSDGIPMEGSTGDTCSLGFQDELSGLGYQMTYEVGEPDEYEFVAVKNVRVCRDERWDRAEGERHQCFEDAVDARPFGDGPAITFDTIEEYEAQCDLCTQSGIREAGELIWDCARKEVESYWRREETIRNRGGLNISGTKATKLVLRGYKDALEALGFFFKVTVDEYDSCERIHEVCSDFGRICKFPKYSWK